MIIIYLTRILKKVWDEKMKKAITNKRTYYLLGKLIFGLFLAALGTVIMIHANIGLFPWGTLNAGLTNSTGISFGVWSQLIGVIIIIGLILMKAYPGIGTLCDIFFVGFFIDTIEATGWIPTPHTLVTQLIFSLIGLFVLSYGMSIYMSCGLGAGPRDGLMLLMMKITGKPVTIVKAGIEITVTVLGLLLGGPFGVGTIMLAFLGGPVLDLVFKWTKFDAASVKQKTLVDLFRNEKTSAQHFI